MEQAVIIRFSYGSTDLSRLFALEDKLIEALEKAGTGDYDGNEVAADGSDGFLYMYGPDADALFKTVKPILATVDFMKGATATLRYGPPEDGTREVDVAVGS